MDRKRKLWIKSLTLYLALAIILYMKYKDINERDKRVRRLWIEGLKMAEIGRIYHISRERVRQILKDIDNTKLDKGIDTK